MKHFARTLALVLLAIPLAAHDFWIAPDSFRPAKGALLNIALYVGDFGKGDEVERKEERTVKFVAATPEGERKIVGRDGATPAGFLRTRSDGIHVLGFQSSRASVTVAPEVFRAYLDERGLDGIKHLREQRGETAREAREVYSRSPKCIVQVGGAAASGWERALALDLELTPGQNPYALAWIKREDCFEALPIQLAFRDQPLSGALVSAISLDAPPIDAQDLTRVLRARTDDSGRVRFKLPRAGRWLIASVHMQALEGDAEAEYESFWASLTFEVPSAEH